MPFEQHYWVGWAHLDANAHMANRAYLDLAADVPVTYFAAAVFSIDAFCPAAVRSGIHREELEYFS
jgi:acyl-CoA thioester hydrolase